MVWDELVLGERRREDGIDVLTRKEVGVRARNMVMVKNGDGVGEG